MKTGLNKVVVAVALCAALILFAGTAKADDLGNITQEWVEAGLTADQVDNLLSASGDTLGQRVQDMLKNGSITQGQYDKIYNSFMSLPAEKRATIKNAYTKGYGEKIYNQVVNAAHENLSDDASIKKHAKDLRDQGLTKEQIAARLKAEGVASEHVKDIVYGQGAEASRPRHIKDVRDSGSQPQQVEKAHERYQGRKVEPSVAGHAKDRPQGTKSFRDSYKAGRPAASNIGHGAVQRRR